MFSSQNVVRREKILLAVRSFSNLGKIIFFGLFSLFLISGAGILYAANLSVLTDIPRSGGSFSEGIIGSPRFANPVLALSDADKDLTALVYSGLMRVAGDGSLVPDLAGSYAVSPDGKEYAFTLKPDLVWHDGEPITAEDVRFTIEKIKDPNIRSPKRGNFEGVQVAAPDARTIVFTLPAPYAPFLGNTTVGIVPKSLWENLSSDEWNYSALNTHPIGSGPYRVKEVGENSSGLPEYYDLVAFPDFTLGEPYIENVRLNFYANENELLSGAGENGEEALSAVSPEKASELQKKGANVIRAPLPRVFAVFFNQNEQDLFTDLSVRQALDRAVDRDYIVNNILHGSAVSLNSPLSPFPPGTNAYSQPEEASTTTSIEERLEKAHAILEKAGWTRNEGTGKLEKKEKSGKGVTKTLSFSFSTSDAPELKAAAESIKRDWEQLGAEVNLKIFEAGDLNQTIIRPRKYDALLFGEIVGREPDPYAFWHSSQRLDPGLNIASYVNASADKILEKLRETSGTGEGENRMALYREFEKTIAEDVPAVFLYSPQFLYVLPSHVENVTLPPIIYPSERFSEIYKWNIETDKVWKIFSHY